MSKKAISNSKKGFTLIEIMIVIAIIGILVGIAIAAGSSAKKGSRDNQRKTDIALLRLKLEAYREQNSIYPVSLNGTTPSLVSSGLISDSVLPKDPTNNGSGYQYIPLGFPSSGSSCGVSYYLYATLENTNSQHATIVSGLTPCDVPPSTLPSTNSPSNIYDVTSPI